MRIFSIRMAVSIVAVTSIAACEGALNTDPPLPAVLSDTDDIDAFAKTVLNGLQDRSIAETREYCGFIIETPDGKLATTPIARGNEASCVVRRVAAPIRASFHTHGSYSPRYDNEVPSVDDVVTDFNAQIDGYISTPGGRLWLLDHETREIKQLCGRGCVISDPNDDPGNAPPVPESFTLNQLRARFG